jgi:cytochrome c oxidase subunit 1
MYPEGPAKVSALIFLVAAPLAMLPEFILGYLGMARQQAAYAPEFTALQIAVTLGTSVLVVGYILPPLYLTWSIFFGRRAAANPWPPKGWRGNTPARRPSPPKLPKRRLSPNRPTTTPNRPR